MTIRQILPAGNHIAHMHIDRGKSGAVKGRRHLHLAVDALLAQDRYTRALPGSNEGRGNVGVTVVAEVGGETGILRPNGCKLLVGAISVVTDTGDGVAGLCPERVQGFSPAVDQLELRGIHHNAPIGPRRRNAGHRVAKANRLGTSEHIGDMFGRHLQDSARLFRKESRIGLIGRDIEINLQPTAPRKGHFQQCDQQATVRAVVVGKYPVVVLGLFHQLKERVNILRGDVGGGAAHLLPHLREHRATDPVLPTTQIHQQQRRILARG